MTDASLGLALLFVLGIGAQWLAWRIRLPSILLLLSAGFPRFGSTVHQGYLFYRTRLVSESIKRFDPLTPMTDPDLVRVLSRQTSAKVGLLPHAVLHAGFDAAQAAIGALASDGVDYIMVDCSDDSDARMSARLACASLGPRRQRRDGIDGGGIHGFEAGRFAGPGSEQRQ